MRTARRAQQLWRITLVPSWVPVVIGTLTVWATLTTMARSAEAQAVKNRVSVLVDSSGSMLLTPEIVTTTKTCTGWNPCTGANNNPTVAQESCNPCVIDTINFRPTCATTWSAQCATDYNNCGRAIAGQATCSATLTVSSGVPTRGDGSTDLPGCDLNGDGVANDSRMYQAKEALHNVVATFGEVEFSLWRYKQVTGGQTCTTDASCPDTPGGLSVLTCEDHDANAATSSVCAFDADVLDGPTTAGFEGNCGIFTHTGASSAFTCNACDFASTFDRANCQMYDLDRVRSGGLSPLNSSSTVTCLPSANPQHRFMRYHGAINNNGTCDPSGAERLVAFPATSFDDNYTAIRSWIDHNQSPFASTDELRPQGGTPIAASLRDMRTSILAALAADAKTPCRKHQVIVLTDGGESCESVAAAVTAAGQFRGLAFTNPAGVNVSNYNVDVYVIGFAICPPGQANCQTRQDLNAIAAAGGTGQAILVNNQLELQAALAQVVAQSVTSERCNGLDDDCDAAVDEGFAGLGNACQAGVGSCLRNGAMVCSADQLGVVCNATAGTPSTEVCNQLDDNCNGLVDDGIVCTGCVPSCSNADHCDICNGRDEDCDGQFDEDFAAAPCGVDTGACQSGTTACSNGVLSCAGAIGPSAEACNGLDDDCDTIVDGMATACYPNNTAGCDVAAGQCMGVCKLGVAVCNNFPQTPTCTGAVTPGVEIACNRLDDDCDGRTDEGAGTEQCNAVDDDCDGRVDEGVAQTDPDIGQACGTPPFDGECRAGALTCVLGAQLCLGEVDPGVEVCDNRDNDCDGQIDDNVAGFGGACGTATGECAPGVLQCVAGAPQCVGGVGPAAEVCDARDNNCNGATDETDPMLGMTCNTLAGGGMVASDTGECQLGVLACAAGGLTCVGTVGPTAERCNRLDDDCDGQTDEDFAQLGTSCTNGQVGACAQTGVYVCAANGSGVVCTAPPGGPSTEACNLVDDDCDGMTDEGPLPLVGEECSSAGGSCGAGQWQCNLGMMTCVGSGMASPEVCNALDDDCDGAIDEAPVPGTGEMCVAPGFEAQGATGACEFGHTVCTAGGLVCDGYVGPAPEICNGLDDDCDGVVDDDATCPAGNVCLAGACAAPCGEGEFPCSSGYVCQQVGMPPVGYCVPDVCLGVNCPSGFACDRADGTCKDLCAGITCASGESCQNGFCLDCFDVPDKCTASQWCVRDANGVGQCQTNGCTPNPCGADEVCHDGTCSAACAAGCAANEACVDGACVVDKCVGKRCGEGVCDPDTGACIDSKCKGVVCFAGEVCVPTTGACEPNPCRTTVCSTGLVCRVDGGGRAVCEAPNAGGDRVTAAGGGCNAANRGPWSTAVWLLLAVGYGHRRNRRTALRRGARATLDFGAKPHARATVNASAAGRLPVSSVLSAALVIALAACNINPYDLGSARGDANRDSNNGGAGDGNPLSDGQPPSDAATPDARCRPQPETCNRADDDCDGQTDESFNLTADPNNCGQCGNRCTYTNAQGLCQNSVCARGACQPGYHDLDGNAADCEYFCIATNNGVERCDERDNNCEGTVDEGFDKQTDVNNCGRCGNVCTLLHASAACVAGGCQVAACDTGFYDVDPAVPGCEYQCTPTNGGVERCDGLDNDCDGQVDDGNPGGGQACGTDTGECTAGATVCSFGVLFCVGATNAGTEVCDNLDNNCDGQTDDGFDKQNDPQHCGGCLPCDLPHAVAGCSVGACTVASCRFGYFDLNGQAQDGCEYTCINTGAERCDGTDNDCDGLIDDGFNLQADAANCGMCGRVCSFTNAAARCAAGGCEMAACNPNFFDLNGNPADGCEYGCVRTNGGVEKCDGLDNDCDGTADEGNPGGGGSCGTDTGECTAGTLTCVAGALACVGQIGAGAEVCDNLDNDCDGQPDDGFNKLTDPQHCGGCTPCAVAHAIAGCTAGACTVAGCLAGWVDLNQNASDGCEYQCTPSGQEVCDGIDNDCDGQIDGNDASLIRPSNFCRSQGECAGTQPTCAGATGWTCVYTDPDVEMVNGQLAAEETRCDNKDNDCDGGADEVYLLKNSACDEDGTFGTSRKLGVCRGRGALVCNAQGTGLQCNITTAGMMASNETCDNRDNDCDGHIDEPYDAAGFAGVRDALVGPVTVGGASILMYRYEASRPDATATSAGNARTRACSSSNRLPWATVTIDEARDACEAGGMRLCRVTRNGAGAILTDEWGRMCEGASNRTYPYGASYVATSCNGSDYDPIAGGVNEDQAIATGSLATCQASDGAMDLSGNLKEWVDDPRVVGGQTVYTLRGGSFDNYQSGLTCDFDFTVVPPTYALDNTGFRCCSMACSAGMAECNNACVDLATSASNCGACGVTCANGTTCSNGYCCPTGTRACGDQCVATGMACP